jgi:hypothetical protein
MVICPIARAVHCTGCPLVKFCPAKTILGDYGKTDESSVAELETQTAAEAPDTSAAIVPPATPES